MTIIWCCTVSAQRLRTLSLGISSKGRHPKHDTRTIFGLQGETVPYVICVEAAEDGTVSTEGGQGIAERAYHPEEVAATSTLRPDPAYYLAQQARATMLF